MAWPTDGTDGWEDFGTDLGGDPVPHPLPAPKRLAYYDPSPLGGSGRTLEQGVRTFGASTVVARGRAASMEVEFLQPEVYGAFLLDWLIHETSTPCALVLDVYDDDRATIRWSAGTSPTHPRPYLVEPDNYGEQEVDIASGAASIGVVTVGLVDPRTVADDQDTGLFTSFLAANGIPDIVGRRVRLRRFISEELGFQVIADGPASSPRLHESYAGFDFDIRDTRETERRVRIFEGGGGLAIGGSFDPTGLKTILPDAVWGGFGYDPGTDTYLIDPAAPLLGRVTAPGLPGFTGGLDIFGIRIVTLTSVPGNDIALRKLSRAAANAGVGELTRTSEPFVSGAITYQNYVVRFPRLHLFWRLQGDTVWQEIGGGDLQLSGNSQYDSSGAIPFAVTNLMEHQPWPDAPNETHREVTEIRFGHRQYLPIVNEDVLPPVGADIELILGYRGPPSADMPVYIEGLTAGELARNVYDGIYSARADDGSVVPTGIRYDEAALLQMTTPVRMRLKEPVTDARDWLEKSIYAPTGWAPALDRVGNISPVSQVDPTSTIGLDQITDAITEPSSSWNNGERIVNVITFKFSRLYRPASAEANPDADGLLERPIVVEWQDGPSIDRNGRRPLELDGVAFAALGDDEGEPVSGDATQEVGWQLSQERQVHVQNRYAWGAATITVAVMRDALPLLRAGDWVTVDLSWFPDLITGRRGLIGLAQVIALGDLDCAWRRVTFEMVVPLVQPGS